ncbi:MAG: PorV/PorQ family protein [Gemmatimonadetes bacterium]|jgi:hypothetical protein|nr:PorV/PorQ family protein [Gemmatimonadota bacterium]
MTRNFKIASVVLALTLVLSVSDRAFASGENRAGTASATELLIPVGGRAMALGGASIATTSGLEALHWNPAGLARASNETELMVSTMSYLADVRVNYVAAGAKFNSIGSFAFDLKALDFGDIPITTEAQPDGTGGQFSPTFFTLGLHFSRALTDRISVGGTSHYIVNRVERVDGTAVSFSAGLQYSNLADIDGLNMGVAVKHIGQRMQYDGSGLLRRGTLDDLRRPASDYKVQSASADLPSLFELGVGYRYNPAGLGEVNISTVFRHNNYTYDQFRTGVEYAVSEMFTVRGGFDYASNTDDDYLYGTAFGFGLQTDIGSLQDVRVDYAYSSVDLFDALNTFTFQVGF